MKGDGFGGNVKIFKKNGNVLADRQGRGKAIQSR